jgi:predicted CxxxxCH...CXXCH cytochrome family protein
MAAIAAVVVPLLLGTPVQASPQYAMDCTKCHTMPPLDSGTAMKDPYTGAVPGNHQSHAASSASSCVICHGDAVNRYATGHGNRVIELEDTIGYSLKSGAFLNQTSVPPNPLGKCSSVACHSNGKGVFSITPSWGRAAFQSPQDCSQCHGSAPDGGNHPSLLGPGAKHGAYLGTGTGSCGYCHNDHTVGGNPFGHATSAVRRTGIEVKFTRGGGFADNQCSNVYCHSNGKGSFVPAAWGGTLDCSGCHGTATSDTLSGKHAKHVNNPDLGTNYGCVACHATTVSDNGTISDRTKHANGSVEVVGGAAVGTVDNGTCATSYCHSDGKGNHKTVTWSQTETLDCKGCHGSDAAPAFVSVAGEPNYANAGADQVKANSHATHMTSASDCQNCHSTTTVNGTSIKPGAPHANGSVEVVAGNGSSFDIAGKTCSNVSCHSGNGIIANVAAAKWGASLGCTGCHGDASTLTSYAHAKHVNPATGMGYACAACHGATVSGSSTIINKTLHGNGVGDVASFYNSSNNTCATSCHSALNPLAIPNWKDNKTGACGSCHNALSTTANGLIATDAHSQHFASTYGPKFDATNADSCAVCHVYTGDTAATHGDGRVQLKPGFARTGTCTTCHQQGTTWANARVTCESCHTTTNGPLSVIGGVTAADKTLAASTGHGKAGIGQSCAACHDDSSNHLGVAGGTNRLIAALTGATNVECVYCHNDSNKVPNADKRITQGHDGFANTCAACHDAHGTSNSMMVMANMSTAVGKSSGISYSGTDTFITADGKGICQVCHTKTTYFKRGVAVDAKSHQQVGSNCLKCHPHNPGPGKTSFLANGACDACHGYPPMPRNLQLAFGTHGQYSSARFEDYSGGGGAHATLAHLDPNITADMGFNPCLACHNGADKAHTRSLPVNSHIENVSVIVDPQYRFSADVGFMGYSGAHLVSGANKTGTCFNVSCHFRPSPQWSIEK